MSLLGLPQIWGWLGAGLLLIAGEVLLAPGSYLLWIGIAALLMAAITALLPLGLASELAIFGILALGCGFAGWRVYGARVENDAARDLHDPAITMVGRVLTLSSAIEGGTGMVRVDDSVWRVSGPELPLGAKVRVTALDGSTLLVEAA
ncbi:MAG: NfeD family protein [Proteobacteria bacterium]|nr:NfeD family protein [Pseudomonadota bacterium]